MKSEVKATSETVLIPGFISQELGLVATESSRKDPLLQMVPQSLLCHKVCQMDGCADQTLSFMGE